MTHVGQEFTLSAIRRIRLFLGKLKLGGPPVDNLFQMIAMFGEFNRPLCHRFSQLPIPTDD